MTRPALLIPASSFCFTAAMLLCIGPLVAVEPVTLQPVTLQPVTLEPVTLENVKEPTANRSDEPKAAAFSLERAVHFLDSAALDWQKQRQCFTCHTNFAYLYARPAVSDGAAHATVRQYAEELVRERWPDKGPRWDAEVVASAAALAFNDAATTGKLHPTSRQALDRMWTLQRADGGWNWLKCDWPPMESDDHYGATLAALAAGIAPDNYAQTESAQNGLAKIRDYLVKNPAPTTHHQTMQLWASNYVDNLLADDSRKATIDKLWSLQKEDGGWNLASLGNWERGIRVRKIPLPATDTRPASYPTCCVFPAYPPRNLDCKKGSCG